MPKLRQQTVQLRPGSGGSGDGIRENPFCAGGRQGVLLAVEFLVLGRNPRVPQDHGQNPPKTVTVLSWVFVPVNSLKSGRAGESGQKRPFLTHLFRAEA